jgi:large subunit ribosomal protein L1
VGDPDRVEKESDMTQETQTPETPPAAKAPKAPQKGGKGRKRGKRYRALAAKVERTKAYSPAEAVKLVKETSQAKFDTTVDLHLRMGVDPRHAEQMVRGSAVLPNGTGKTVRIVVFAQGDKAREAQAAGADVVGADDLAKRIEGGWLDFDVAIATPDMMGTVGKLGKVLGPRGLMPNPKSGTVTFDLAKAVKDSKGGRIEFRVDKTGVVHTVVGKSSFTEQALLQNLATLMDALNRARPAGLKANYIESVYLTSTQGPSVKIDLGEATALAGRATT